MICNVQIDLMLRKGRGNQQKVSYRFTLIVAVAFYFLLKLINVYFRDSHIKLIKALNAFTKSKEEVKDQELKPYHYLTDLEIAWTYEGQSKITESWLISFYWVGSFG